MSSPPTGMPVELMLRASARRRRNQETIATATGRYPPRLEPSAIRKNVMKNVGADPIWLNRMKASPKTVMPIRISVRGPNRSVSHP